MSNHAAVDTRTPLEPGGARVVDEEHVNRVARKLLRGIVVPLLGAGVNMSGRPSGFAYTTRQHEHLPNGRELARVLAEEFDYPSLANQNLDRVSQFLDVMEGSGELYQALHDLFNYDYPAKPVHRFLARLQPVLRACGKGSQVILTTNYDDALERAFDEIGEEYDLVVYVCTHPTEHRGRFVHVPPKATKAIPIVKANQYKGLDPRRRAVILKMHGAVVRCETFEQDNYVITEDHYIDYLAHTDITNLLPTPIPQRLRNSHFLFLGYAMRDWNLRVILRRIWGAQGLEYPSWSIQRTPDELETKFWEDRRVAVFHHDVDDYVERLREAVEDRCGPAFAP
jgi:hypothetical protein